MPRSTLFLITLAAIAILFFSLLAFNAQADSHYWTSDIPKDSNDVSAWNNGIPGQLDNLFFASNHTGRCTINQALTFGDISQGTGAGEVAQGNVDFGFANLNSGSTWTGSDAKLQTYSGNILKTTGVLTNLRLHSTGTFSTLTLPNGAVISYIQVSGTVNLTNAHYIQNIQVDPSSELSLRSGDSIVQLYIGQTFDNQGTISGPGSVNFFLSDEDRTIAFGAITARASIMAHGASSANRVATYLSGNFNNTLKIESEHATNTMTLNMNGHDLIIANTMSLTIGTRGNLIGGTISVASVGTTISWSISALTGTINWNVTNLSPNRTYNYRLDNVLQSPLTADGSGIIAMSMSTWSTHTYDLRLIPLITGSPSHSIAEMTTYSASFSCDQAVTWTIASDAWNFLQADGSVIYGTPDWRHIGSYWYNITATNVNGQSWDNVTLEVLDDPNIQAPLEPVFQVDDSPGNAKDHTSIYAAAIGMAALFGILATLAYLGIRKKK
jgi:hypothetical protein